MMVMVPVMAVMPVVAMMLPRGGAVRRRVV